MANITQKQLIESLKQMKEIKPRTCWVYLDDAFEGSFASSQFVFVELAERFAKTNGSHRRSIICLSFSGEEEGLAIGGDIETGIIQKCHEFIGEAAVSLGLGQELAEKYEVRA